MLKLSPLSTIGLATIIALVLLLWGKSCKISKQDKEIADLKLELSICKGIPSKTDTVYKYDSVKLIEHAPIPYQTEAPVITHRFQYDTFYIAGIDTVYVDTLLTRHYSTNFYKKTFPSKYGNIDVFDTVSRNKLLGHSVNIDSLKIPTITNTIVQTKYEDRTQLMLGVETMWGKRYDSSARVGVTALLKFKKGFGVEYGRYIDFNGNQFNKAGIKKTITFKKP